MTDPSYDLAEILRSPLDPEPGDDAEGRARWAIVAAFVLGAAAAAATVTALVRAEEAPAVAAAPASSTTAASLEPVPAAYPAGYTPIDDHVAVRPEEPRREGDRLLVPLTMVVARDAVAADVARPLGGVWELRTSGDAALSRRIIFDADRPSILSVEFPAFEGRIESLTLVDRWDGREVATAVELPWPGLGNPMPVPLEIDLGDGATLTITHLELGNFVGQIRWELSGAAYGLAGFGVQLYRDDGAPVGGYVAPAASLDPQPRGGFAELRWAQGIRAEQDDATTMELLVDAWIGAAVRVDIVISLP